MIRLYQYRPEEDPNNLRIDIERNFMYRSSKGFEYDYKIYVLKDIRMFLNLKILLDLMYRFNG